MSGFGGAGAFSDGKYNITNDFGGTLYEYIGKAQTVNEQLTKTNSEFVEVLHSYKSDLDTIKNDVTEIKQNMKG